MEMNKFVYDVIKENGTNDPFIIAENNDISYLYNDDFDESFHAIFLNLRNNPTIIINGKYKYSPEKYFYMAHELLHALYHHETIAFYHNATHEKAKNEHEANQFATLLLLSDQQTEEGMTYEELLRINYIPVEMIDLIGGN